jgi:ankyrin repeat protein
VYLFEISISFCIYLFSDISPPIHSAAFGGHLETVKVLVQSGADLNLRNYRDELPIDTAKRQNQVEVITYLENLK